MTAMENTTVHRALVLLSGGLDSQLAICLLREQGVAVQAIGFESVFFSADRARAAAAHLGVPLVVEPFTRQIAAAVEHPRHGFGTAMNPCIDCHIAMLKCAGDGLVGWGCDFLATGEVLDQRPMSQNRRRLIQVAEESGYGDRIVRPLSARHLPETRPEREGWVDRSRLLDLQGRRRTAQFALAERFGLKDVPTPAGGCVLTDPNFCGRVRDLREHGCLSDGRVMRRLRWGRQFRLGPQAKLNIGRDETENGQLTADCGPDEYRLTTEGVSGPVAVLSAEADPGQVQEAAAFCAAHSDGRNQPRVRIRVVRGLEDWLVEVEPARRDRIEQVRIT
jgi:tRNA-specific 2-thiouridylase